MELWHVLTVENLIVGAAYLAISYIILSGLIRTGQVTSNKLGLATGLIFLTCAVHHATHAFHMLIPVARNRGPAKALALRDGWHWQTVGLGCADGDRRRLSTTCRCVAATPACFRGAQMFEDMKVRQRQALDAERQHRPGPDRGEVRARPAVEDARSREAIEETLRKARALITELLGERHSEVELGPGDLRRAQGAAVTPGSGRGL